MSAYQEGTKINTEAKERVLKNIGIILQYKAPLISMSTNVLQLPVWDCTLSTCQHDVAALTMGTCRITSLSVLGHKGRNVRRPRPH